MPYTIERQGGEWCVYKADADGAPIGDTLGCHASETGAEAQRAALYANEADKGAGLPTEYKTFPSVVTGTDEAQGIVETVFAVFGNVDSGLDVLHPGSFSKSLAERGLKVRVLDHHNAGSIMNVIGKPLELRELTRDELPGDLLAQYPEATGGAYAKIQMLMDTPEGRGAFLRLREKAVDEWSFGYTPLDVDYSKAMAGDKEVTVRNLRTCKLFEVSPVIWGMNPATTTLGAKDAKAVMKTEADGEHPASHYLIVEDPEKPTTWHLRVRNAAGELDHRLMGGAWAALHGGYRGSRYEGPGKEEAIRKLTALYEREGLDTPKAVDDALAERKEALVATLRAALAEAEAFVAAQAVSETEDTAPADAGRVEHAAEEGAEPVAVPLTPEQEAQRLALLSEIQQLTEE